MFKNHGISSSELKALHTLGFLQNLSIGLRNANQMLTDVNQNTEVLILYQIESVWILLISYIVIGQTDLLLPPWPLESTVRCQ